VISQVLLNTKHKNIKISIFFLQSFSYLNTDCVWPDSIGNVEKLKLHYSDDKFLDLLKIDRIKLKAQMWAPFDTHSKRRFHCRKCSKLHFR